jgi:hypothetical protein
MGFTKYRKPSKSPVVNSFGAFYYLPPSHNTSLHTVTFNGTIDGIAGKTQTTYRQTTLRALFYKGLLTCLEIPSNVIRYRNQ